MLPAVRFALGIAGMNPEQVARIEAALPAAVRLVETFKQMEPIYEKARPDIDAVLPVLVEVINFIKGEKQ